VAAIARPEGTFMTFVSVILFRANIAVPRMDVPILRCVA
jgi:hypothetical protein